MTEEQKIKKQFAYELLKNPHKPFEAALVIADYNSALALEILVKWERDPEVKNFKTQLLEEYGEEFFLPTKAEMLHDILHRARNESDNESYVKMMKLAADMRGMIEKPGITVNNNISNTTNKVMLIPMQVGGGNITEDEWEKRTLDQQATLVSK